MCWPLGHASTRAQTPIWSVCRGRTASTRPRPSVSTINHAKVNGNQKVKMLCCWDILLNLNSSSECQLEMEKGFAKCYVESKQSCHKVEPESSMDTWIQLSYKLEKGVSVLCEVTNKAKFRNCSFYGAGRWSKGFEYTCSLCEHHE